MMHLIHEILSKILVLYVQIMNAIVFFCSSYKGNWPHYCAASRNGFDCSIKIPSVRHGLCRFSHLCQLFWIYSCACACICMHLHVFCSPPVDLALLSTTSCGHQAMSSLWEKKKKKSLVVSLPLLKLKCIVDNKLALSASPFPNAKVRL